MIEDGELRILFGSECEEHLQTLDDGLLRLESAPRDETTIEAVFRAAHSLKGSSRMVGAPSVEVVAHALEDYLSDAKRGLLVLSPLDLDKLGIGLRALRQLVDEAVIGTPSAISATQAIAQMSRALQPSETHVETPSGVAPSEGLQHETIESKSAPTTAPQTDFAATSSTRSLQQLPQTESPSLLSSQPIQSPPLAPDVAKLPLRNGWQNPHDAAFSNSSIANRSDEPNRVESTTLVLHDLVTQISPSPQAISPSQSALSASSGDFKIQTMRVPPARLDALMTLASELAVTTARVTRGLSALDEIGEMCDRWGRDLAARNRHLILLQAHSPHASALFASQRNEEIRLAQLRELWLAFKDVVPKNAARLSSVAEGLEASVRNVRLLPLSTVFALFPRSVRDLSRTQEKEIQLVVEGGETPADKRVLEELKDTLMHILRNAIDHGIEAPRERLQKGKPSLATLGLRAQRTATGIIIEISDDGRGLNTAAIRRAAFERGLHSEEELDAISDEQLHALIFAPGFSTNQLVTEVSGRGVGMDVARHNVEKLKGTIAVASVPNVGCKFTIRLPLTLSTTRVLLVCVGAQVFALPVEFVRNISAVRDEQIFTSEGRATTMQNEEAIPLVPLSQLLELPLEAETSSSTRAAKTADVVSRNSSYLNPHPASQARHPSPQLGRGGIALAAASLVARGEGHTSSTQNVANAMLSVTLEIGSHKIGVVVDAVLDEQEVVFKALGPLLKRVRNVAGTTILMTGEVCLVLNAHDLLRCAHIQNSTSSAQISEKTRDGSLIETSPIMRAHGKIVLLVEDSITTRTQEKRILESAGYEVVTAVDGADGLAKLASRSFDAIVSDVQMPNLDGLSMTAKIREDARYRDLPIVLVTSLSSDEDKQRGVEVGADAYIAKGTFEQKALLETLERLVP